MWCTFEIYTFTEVIQKIDLTTYFGDGPVWHYAIINRFSQ